MTLRDRVTNSATVFFLGAVVTGFAAGFVGHRAVTEAQGQTLILKTRLENYEQNELELAEARTRISELEAISSKQQLENTEEGNIQNKLSVANDRIEQLERTVAEQLDQITKYETGATENTSGDNDLEQSTSTKNENSSIEVINGKQEFSMAVGDLKAIGDSSMLLTIMSIMKLSGSATYSNINKGIEASITSVKQAVPIIFYEGCSVIPIKFADDADGKRVTFISEC